MNIEQEESDKLMNEAVREHEDYKHLSQESGLEYLETKKENLTEQKEKTDQSIFAINESDIPNFADILVDKVNVGELRKATEEYFKAIESGYEKRVNNEFKKEIDPDTTSKPFKEAVQEWQAAGVSVDKNLEKKIYAPFNAFRDGDEKTKDILFTIVKKKPMDAVIKDLSLNLERKKKSLLYLIEASNYNRPQVSYLLNKYSIENIHKLAAIAKNIIQNNGDWDKVFQELRYEKDLDKLLQKKQESKKESGKSASFGAAINILKNSGYNNEEAAQILAGIKNPDEAMETAQSLIAESREWQ